MMDEFKILMIAPILSKEMVLEDIGVSSITAYLREKGFNVKIKSYFEHEVNYDEIIEYNPAVIGIPVYNPTLDFVAEISKTIKNRLPKCIICLGNVTATFHADEILEQYPFVDYIIRGEGEISFFNFVTKIKEGKDVHDTKSLVYRKNNEIIYNEMEGLIENLDNLPFPSRDLLVQNKIRTAMISSARGCTRTCYFCCTHSFWKFHNGFKWRGRSPKNVVDELEILVKNYNIKQFWFADPSFEDPGFNAKRLTELATEIINRQLKISYFAYIRAGFYKIVSHELMELLKKSGLCSVIIGIETANDSDLKIYGKKVTIEENIQAMKFFEKYDISVEIGFINFNPYSTFDGLRQNAEFLEKSGQAGYFFLYITNVRVYKGSRIYEMLEKDNLLKRKKINDDYGYEYQDKRIEQFIRFLNNYFDALQNEANVLFGIFRLTRHHPDKLAHFKHHFVENKNSELANCILSHEEKLKAINSKLNSRVSEWFWKMLDMTEKNWDKNTATLITQQYLGKEYLFDLIKDFDIEKIKLLKTLAKINKEYILYL